ncbi:cytochrome P450 [Trametes punicea]|nr:cytochrome P450 [Trametes punicea]
MAFGSAPLVLALLSLLAFVRHLNKKRPLKVIQGPPSPSFLVGHLEDLYHQKEAGELEKKWLEEYGSVWRIKGCLGEDELMIADPRALQYIFHQSSYRFSKSAVERQVSRELTGEGLLFATGEDHARIRKIINPAFSPDQLAAYFPSIRRAARKLTQKWEDLLQTSPEAREKLSVLQWLGRCTFDAISEIVFDIDCNTLEDPRHPVMDACRNMLVNALPRPSRSTLLFRSFWRYIPLSILRFARYLPTKDHAAYRRSSSRINGEIKKVIREKTQAILADKVDSKRDITSIVVKANATANHRARLTDTEMISQMATFLLAGYQKPSTSLAWLLYELAKRPDYQHKIREEARDVRRRVKERGEEDLSIADLDSMVYAIAAVKEVLRLHSVITTIFRVSSKDEVIPLTYPITTATGNTVDEIVVPAGTNLHICIPGYNRLPQVWGPDAHLFNPDRFVEHDKMGDTYVGVTSHLMTFGAGSQACIGWRFAMIEMQAILVELIEHFDFALPEDKPRIVRFPAGMMLPVVEGAERNGPQMPLRVTPVA